MRIVAVAVFAFAIAAHAQQAPTPINAVQTANAVAAVQSFFNSVPFECDLAETITIKASNRSIPSTGHFVSAPGGKLDYTSSSGDHVVSDGTTLDVLDAVKKQMLVTPAPASSSPIAFFLDTPSLSTFTFVAYAGADFQFPGGVVLMGTPKTPNATVTTALLSVDLGSKSVRRILLVDGQGNRDRIDLIDVQRNGSVSAPFALITPPVGTTIVRQGVAPTHLRP